MALRQHERAREISGCFGVRLFDNLANKESGKNIEQWTISQKIWTILNILCI